MMRVTFSNLRWRVFERLDAFVEWLRMRNGGNASDELVLRMARMVPARRRCS